MDSFEKMYSVKEVAAITGWGSDTIRRLIYRGHLRAVLYGAVAWMESRALVWQEWRKE